MPNNDAQLKKTELLALVEKWAARYYWEYAADTLAKHHADKEQAGHGIQWLYQFQKEVDAGQLKPTPEEYEKIVKDQREDIKMFQGEAERRWGLLTQWDTELQTILRELQNYTPELSEKALQLSLRSTDDVTTLNPKQCAGRMRFILTAMKQFGLANGGKAGEISDTHYVPADFPDNWEGPYKLEKLAEIMAISERTVQRDEKDRVRFYKNRQGAWYVDKKYRPKPSNEGDKGRQIATRVARG